VPTCRASAQIGFDPLLETDEPQLLETRDLALRERLVDDVGERRPSPQAECLAQERRRVLGRAGSEGVTPLGDELFEPLRVELAAVDPESVARSDGLDPVRSEALPQRCGWAGRPTTPRSARPGRPPR
jgi:hypothetical protein